MMAGEGAGSVTRRQALGLFGAGAVGLLVAGQSPKVALAAGHRGEQVVPVFGGGDLPGWFDANRIQAMAVDAPNGWWHTGSTQRQELYDRTGELMHDLGARAFTRYMKTRDEDPWFPSAVPTGPNGERLFDNDRTNTWHAYGNTATRFVPAGTDLPAENVAEAQAAGMSLIGYYTWQFDHRIADAHPDWVMRLPDGSPNNAVYRDGFGTMLDVASPFREVVGQRLLELADRGVQGFYFDLQHLPPWVVDSEWGAREYEQATGNPLPIYDIRPPSGDYIADYGTFFDMTSFDPAYLDWLQYKLARITETFEYWKSVVKASHPDVVFVITAAWVPALTRPDATLALCRVADSAKTEAAIPYQEYLHGYAFANNPELVAPAATSYQLAGVSLIRDSAQGRPPHIWSGFGLPNTEHALGWASWLITCGAVANLNVIPNYETADPQSPSYPFTPIPAMEAVFDLGQQLSPYLSGLRPLRYAAVHFSEHSRNMRLSNEEGCRDAWVEVLGAFVGAFETLTDAKVPVGTVDDEQLAGGELDGYDLLFLPNPTELTHQQRTALARAHGRGLKVIGNSPHWQWTDLTGRPQAMQQLTHRIQHDLARSPARLAGGPDTTYLGAYAATGTDGHSRTRVVLPVSNDFSWVQILHPNFYPDTPVNPPAPAAHGATLAWRADLLPQAAGQREVLEAVTGQHLPVHATGERRAVDLPDFDHLAVIVIQPER